MQYIYRLFWPGGAVVARGMRSTDHAIGCRGHRHHDVTCRADTPPGTQYTLAATVAPADATDTVVTWTSSIISSFSADQQMWVMK